LNRDHKKLILDASVLINLLGTGLSDVLLKGLNRVIVVDEVALREVTIDPFSRADPTEVLDRLRENGLIEVVRMSSETYDLFMDLTGGDPPDDLDDGEAATLAQAALGDCVAVIDEKKATRIAGVHFPNVTVLNSLDLLTSSELLQLNGRDGIANMVYLALRNARMRVAPSERQWILELLGNDRARECVSLGFRSLAV
jgi:hypothetical protein